MVRLVLQAGREPFLVTPTHSPPHRGTLLTWHRRLQCWPSLHLPACWSSLPLPTRLPSLPPLPLPLPPLLCPLPLPLQWVKPLDIDVGLTNVNVWDLPTYPGTVCGTEAGLRMPFVEFDSEVRPSRGRGARAGQAPGVIAPDLLGPGACTLLHMQPGLQHLPCLCPSSSAVPSPLWPFSLVPPPHPTPPRRT